MPVAVPGSGSIALQLSVRAQHVLPCVRHAVTERDRSHPGFTGADMYEAALALSVLTFGLVAYAYLRSQAASVYHP